MLLELTGLVPIRQIKTCPILQWCSTMQTTSWLVQVEWCAKPTSFNCSPHLRHSCGSQVSTVFHLYPLSPTTHLVLNVSVFNFCTRGKIGGSIPRDKTSTEQVCNGIWYQLCSSQIITVMHCFVTPYKHALDVWHYYIVPMFNPFTAKSRCGPIGARFKTATSRIGWYEETDFPMLIFPLVLIRWC
jgi:hypothetical protein